MNDDQLMRQLEAMDRHLTDGVTVRAARGRVWRRLQDERPALTSTSAVSGQTARHAGRSGAILGFRAGPSRGGWRAGMDMAAVAVLVLGLLFGAASRGLFSGNQPDGSTTTAAAASVPADATPSVTAAGTPSVDDNIRNNRPEGSEQLPASAYNALPDPEVYGTLWSIGYQPTRFTIAGSALAATYYRYASTAGDRIGILIVDYPASDEGLRQAKLYAQSQIETLGDNMYVSPTDGNTEHQQTIDGCSDVSRTQGQEYQTSFPIGVTTCLDETQHRLILATTSGYLFPSNGSDGNRFLQMTEASDFVVEQVVGYKPSNGTATPVA